MKIRIGENDVETPVRAELYETNLEVLLLDANNVEVVLTKPIQAELLNELSSLRQERDALQKRVEELEALGERIVRAKNLVDDDFWPAVDDLEKTLNNKDGE